MKIVHTLIVGALLAGCTDTEDPAKKTANDPAKVPATAPSELMDTGSLQGILSNMAKAYGGSNFENLKTVTIKTDLRYGWLGQGQYSDYTDLEPMRKLYHFDLEKSWGSEEAWGGGGSYAERVFTTDEGQYTVNYLNQYYEHNPEADFYGHFGGEIRGSDILLAWDLLKNKESAKLSGSKMFRGSKHSLVTYDMPGTSVDPVLWVDDTTGLISKMKRQVPNFGLISYVFGNHRTTAGLSYADDFELYVDDKLVEYAKSISVSPGGVSASIWSMDKGINAMPETISSDDMVVDHIAGSVHYAGQGGGWGAFVDAGDHIIGIGAYGNLGERFSAYQEAQGNQKPLKYQVVTHHHSDHLESVTQALDLGAIILAPEMARVNLEEAAGRALTDSELRIVSDKISSIGPVSLYLISTRHAPEFLLPYVESEKIILDEDHYYGQLKDRASYVSANAMSLIGEVQRLGLQPETLVSTHSRKAEKWSEILERSKQHIPGKCPTGREICQDLIK